MNLQENIRRILKESVAPQVRRRHEEFDRIFEHYRDSFKDHPYKTFRSFWNTLMESSLETIYYALFSKKVSDDDWEESAEYIEKYLIKKYYDDTKKMWEKKHRNRINESENKNIEKNLRLIRKLLETIDIDGLCKIWVEYNPEDGDYEIRSTTTIRHSDMTEELDYIEDTIRSWKLNTYIFIPNYVENCEDEVEFMNESTKQTNHMKILKELVEPYKKEDCICDIKVSFDVEDNYYNVYLVFSQEELHDKFSDVYGIRSWISKMIRDVTIELEAFLPIPNIYVGKYSKPNCQWSPLNESKQERKFTKLLNNIEEYLNSNSYKSVVRFMVDYDEVMDDVIVNIFIDPEKARELGGGINSVIKRTGKKIMEDLSVFPFDFKYHIHFEKPQLNESIRRILREETKLPNYFRRRIDMETLEQIYTYVLKVVSKRYTDNKKRLNAMTPYKFNHMVTSNLIEDVCENFELQCGDDGDRFNQLWDFLNDRYSKRNIKQFYEIR